MKHHAPMEPRRRPLRVPGGPSESGEWDRLTVVDVNKFADGSVICDDRTGVVVKMLN